MLSIFIIFDISKFDTSIVVRARQPSNISAITITFSVLKCDKSIEVRDEHPENVYAIFTTESVHKFSMPSMVVRFSNP